MNKVSSLDPEEDKSYALLGFLVDLIDSQGIFTNNLAEEVRVSDHVYVVGGAVRNFVIGKPVKDIDIVIDAIALSTKRKVRDAAWFAEIIKRQAPFDAEISQESNDYGVEILHIHGDWIINGVNVSGQDIEIAFARKESYATGGYTPEQVEKATIKEDALRREFTFNTLLWSFADLKKSGPSEDIIQDPLGTGLNDLKDNVIDTPLDPDETFQDDASRMMRALKFQYKYGFNISPRVQKSIEKNSIHIKNVPSEVLYTLLTTTILNQSNYKQALEEMKQNNLLREIISYMNSKEPFRVSIKNWVEENRDMAYLFNLLDYKIPIQDRVEFLTEEERGIFRSNILSMPSEGHYDYLELVKNIGPAIRDKSFFIKTFNEIKDQALLSMSDIPTFRVKFFEPAARELALSNPDLLSDPAGLREQILSNIRSRLDHEFITEASVDVDRKLFVLAKYFKDNKDFLNFNKVGRLLGAVFNIKKEAKELDIEVPQLSGDVYVFDLDDTLFWSPEWHTLVDTDINGNAVDVDMSFPNTLYKAVDFIKKINAAPSEFLRKDKRGLEQPLLESEFRDEIGSISLKREVVDIPILGKTAQVVFVVVGSDGTAIDIDTFKKYFSTKYSKLFDLRGKYVDGKVIIGGDARFYQSPKTLGVMPNPDIFRIYKEKARNSIILTARETVEGMREGIEERIVAAGAPLPLAIFTKPPGASGGRYKGHVIGRIASQPSVNSVIFYDDNLRYITGTNDVLREEYDASIIEKVEIVMVDISDKPDNMSPHIGEEA